MIAFLLQKFCCHLPELRIIVDVEDPNRVAHTERI
jgi:hypothetical protein